MLQPAALEARGIDIVFHDEHLLVLAKPSGLPSQAGKHGDPGLIEHVHAAGLGGAALVHRLDQPASGLLVLGCSALGNRALTHALRAHRVGRTYLAVLGAPATTPRWDRDLDGKRAVTQVASMASPAGYHAVRLQLETGRTHQIRRHAAMAGTPIVGDRRYGGALGRAWPRLALHAFELELTHPATGNRLRWRAPLPSDLHALWTLAGGSAETSALPD